MKLKLLFALLIVNICNAQTQIGQNIDGKNNGDMSGESVSLSANGNIVAIGAELNSDNGFHSGHVRVYENISGTWTQVGQDIEGQSVGERSGYSVSLSADGNIVAIGAPNNEDAGQAAGQVRVYENISGIWTQVGQDINGKVNQFGFGGNSGYSVSLSSDGSSLAIGTPHSDNSFHDYSHVSVYQNTGVTWTQLGNDIIGENITDMSGISISLSSNGEFIAIGAPLNDNNGNNSGHVRVYENISGTWTQVGQDIEGQSEGDHLGHKVSISADGTILAVSAPQFAFGNNDNSGYVRLYKNISGIWTQIGQDINGQLQDRFGNKLTLSANGKIVLIGSNNTYYSRVFENNSGKWVQVCTIGTKQGHYFGLALSADGNIGAIGSPYGTISDKGVTQIYDLSSILSSDKFVLENFKIYPNPTTDILNIELENSLVLEKVLIYNTTGQLIKESKEKIINLNGLAKGIYHVQVITDKGKATQKLVVK